MRVGAVEISVDGSLVRAVIDRPEARNAIDDDVIVGLEGALDVADQESARVILLRGSNATFSAGADLSVVASLLDDLTALDRFVDRLRRVLWRFEHSRSVSVCVVEGYALAGGCELLLACDLPIASTDAQIGDRHLELGLLPGAGGSARLLSAVSTAQARRLLLTGEMIDGTTAAEWGLVAMAVPPAALEHEVARVVERLLDRDARALASVKRLAVEGQERWLREAVDREAVAFLEHLRDCEELRGRLEAFLATDPPRRHGGGARR